MSDHRCFTVATTNYLRNLDRDDLNERCVAIHYQAPPKKTAGGTSFGLCVPALVVTLYMTEPDAIAQRIADILERHWDDDDQPQPAESDPFPEAPLPDAQLANGGACS